MLSRRSLLKSSLMLGGAAALSTSRPFEALAQATTMRLYWFGSAVRAERTRAVIKLFEAANPGITINGETTGNDYWPKLSTMIAGSNAPDIYTLEPNSLAAYVRRGASRPLDEYLGKVINTEKLPAGILDLGTVDGKVAGMPLSRNAFGLLYDKEIFAKHGVTPPGPETTWDEFAKLAIDLTKTIAQKNFWAAPNASRHPFVFESFLHQRSKLLWTENGGPGYDAKDAADWYGYWESLAKNGGCVSAEVQALDQAVVDTNPLTGGNAATAFAYSNQLLAYQNVSKKQLGITSYPTAEKGGKSGLFYRPGMHFMIATNAAQPELAARFINYFVNDVDAGKVLGAERGAPLNSDVVATVLPELDEVSRTSIDYLDSIAGRVGAYPPPVPLGVSDFNASAFGPIADKVAFGQLTPQQAGEELVAAAAKLAK